eukprot:scaffold7903_cov187-Skeletonema_marinoi.AAC.1
MASSGHLRRCSDADTDADTANKYLSREKDASILSLPTLMALDTIWPSTEELAASQMASSGHLRRCSDADTANKYLSREKDASILSFPTIMGHYKLLIAIFTA